MTLKKKPKLTSLVLLVVPKGELKKMMMIMK